MDIHEPICGATYAAEMMNIKVVRTQIEAAKNAIFTHHSLVGEETAMGNELMNQFIDQLDDMISDLKGWHDCLADAREATEQDSKQFGVGA